MCRDRGTAENLALEWAPQDNFGLWGACMRVGADLNEWSLVRQQVRTKKEGKSERGEGGRGRGGGDGGGRPYC